MTSRKRIKKQIKGSKKIERESTTTTKKGSKQENELTITNERGERTSNSSFKKGSKQPIAEVERKERKALSLKK